jgi:CarboxypepD_reg-like domain/Secretion system C-terminal sorting domain
MAKKLQLQVPVPCHENWEKMTNAEKGRFCSSCQKTVIDFSNMSDREIALFFKKPWTGSVCGRFMEDQLNREMEIPRKRIPWVNYFFQFLLPGFLLSMKATAQGKVNAVEKEAKIYGKDSKQTGNYHRIKYRVDPKCSILQGDVEFGYAAQRIETFGTVPKKIEKIPSIRKDTSIISGKVIDENGEPVPFATVMIKGTKNGTAADSKGVFSLTTVGSGHSIYLIATSVGFLAAEAKVTEADTAADSIIVLRLSAVSMGEVVITDPVRTHRKGMVMSVKNISGYGKIPARFTQEQFKVYPNPMATGSSLHIAWNKKVYGDHSLQLFSATGQLIFRNDIYIDQEARVLSIDMPSVPAGNYFLRITNEQTSKSYSEKIIIQ